MHDPFVRSFILAVMIPALTVPGKIGYEQENTTKVVTVESSYGQEDGTNIVTVDSPYEQENRKSSELNLNQKLTAKFTVDGKKKSVQVETYVSKYADHCSVLATNAAKLKMFRCTFKKSGKTTNVTNSDLSGVNSVLCANGGSSVSLTRGTLTSDADGANAIFASGVKSVVETNDVKITTTGNSSKGLYVTNGGIIYANKAQITTKGKYSAPLATYKSGGTIRLTNGTLHSSGKSSPCILSKGNIIVNNVAGTAVASQAAVIEGKNSITLVKSNLTGRNGILLYQENTSESTSGTSIFTAKDSVIKTTTECPMFYIKNTNAKIELTNTKLIKSSSVLIQVTGDTNNTGNASGSTLTLRATDQILKGTILCDKGSNVELRLADGATYQGCTDSKNAGKVSIVLSAKAKWILSGDTYVSSITDLDYALGNIESLGYNIYYDVTNPSNSWLKGTTTELLGGGKLIPSV